MNFRGFPVPEGSEDEIRRLNRIGRRIMQRHERTLDELFKTVSWTEFRRIRRDKLQRDNDEDEELSWPKYRLTAAAQSVADTMADEVTDCIDNYAFPIFRELGLQHKLYLLQTKVYSFLLRGNYGEAETGLLEFLDDKSVAKLLPDLVMISNQTMPIISYIVNGFID